MDRMESNALSKINNLTESREEVRILSDAGKRTSACSLSKEFSLFAPVGCIGFIYWG